MHSEYFCLRAVGNPVPSGLSKYRIHCFCITRSEVKQSRAGSTAQGWPRAQFLFFSTFLLPEPVCSHRNYFLSCRCSSDYLLGIFIPLSLSVFSLKILCCILYLRHVDHPYIGHSLFPIVIYSSVALLFFLFVVFTETVGLFGFFNKID